MATAEAAIDDFLAQKRIAVAGVSREKGGKHGGNVVYQRLRERGYQVFAVNPNADTVEGDPCYRDLASIPGGVDAVVIATAPAVAPSVVQQCKELGHHPGLDAPLVRRRERLEGGPRAVPPERDRLDRRRLPPDVRPHLRRRASLHEAVRAGCSGSCPRRPDGHAEMDGRAGLAGHPRRMTSRPTGARSPSTGACPQPGSPS